VNTSRLTIAGLILAVFFVGMTVLGAWQPTGTGAILTADDSVDTLYQALLTATITGVTLVLTISQLVLSQELGAIGDQRERLDGAMKFQQDFEDLSGLDVTPAEPASFFEAMLEQIADRVDHILEATDLEDECVDVLTDIRQRARGLTDDLKDAEFGRFQVVRLALDFDYSKMIAEARAILNRRDDSVTEPGRAATEELNELLQMFGVAREHFKTLFFQWELTELSRRIMVSAVPAILASAAMLTYFQPEDFLGSTLGLNHASLLVTATTTISLAPFALLVAYMARIMTVTQETLSVGPFLLRTTDQ
jgi:AcrR family transcriptional regulator